MTWTHYLTALAWVWVAFSALALWGTFKRPLIETHTQDEKNKDFTFGLMFVMPAVAWLLARYLPM